MRAVVFAGGVNERPLFPGYRPGLKALLEIGGKTLLAYVMAALNGVGELREVAVVGERVQLEGVTGPCLFAPPGSTLMESLMTGLALFPEDGYVLLTTADLPMLRPEMVEQFLALCRARPGGDLYLSLVPRERFHGPCARCNKNFNHFADGSVCHGNLALARPALLHNREAMARVNGVYRNRKSPIQSALALGPRLGLAYVLGVHFLHLLRLEGLARLLSERFAMKMVPVLCSYPEIAVDVDEAADYQIACEVLG